MLATKLLKISNFPLLKSKISLHLFFVKIFTNKKKKNKERQKRKEKKESNIKKEKKREKREKKKEEEAEAKILLFPFMKFLYKLFLILSFYYHT